MIRASEVGDYVFCNQQWWLQRVHGVRSTHVERLAAGTTYHEDHADKVETLNRRQLIVSVLVGLAVMGLLLWLMLLLVGVA